MSERNTGGVFSDSLLVGLVTEVGGTEILVSTSQFEPKGSRVRDGQRHGKGQVGEFVLVQASSTIILGRIVKSSKGTGAISTNALRPSLTEAGAVFRVAIYAHLDLETLIAKPGVEEYPRIGDRVYSAAQNALQRGFGTSESTIEAKKLNLGMLSSSERVAICVSPANLFGRHCAILGATGGGKSWTVSRLIEQCVAAGGKAILLDPTGEYAGWSGNHTKTLRLGGKSELPGDVEVCLPQSAWEESDFIALFRPSAGAQAPKFRDAMNSLRIVAHLATIGDQSNLVKDGVLKKEGVAHSEYQKIFKKASEAGKIDNPKAAFDVHKLADQIWRECIYPTAKNSGSFYGGPNEREQEYCLTLCSRVRQLVRSDAFRPVFQRPSDSVTDFTYELENFIKTKEQRLLRVDLSKLSHEFDANLYICNAIGRHLMTLARTGRFRDSPTVVFADEAHSLFGEDVGFENFALRLDAFELIAREGRKYGLVLCLASQRPVDLGPTVLSQMGSLIVHRLSSDADRFAVERSTGMLDSSSAAFLPSLSEGEAILIGSQFPLPIPIQVGRPTVEPNSSGPRFHAYWKPPT